MGDGLGLVQRVIALAGALIAQQEGYADASRGLSHCYRFGQLNHWRGSL